MENNNANENRQQESELSLMELITKLWKGKWIIAGITIIFLVLSVLYSWVILDEKYISKASLTAESIQEIDYNISTYVNELLSDEVLTKTIDDLDLKNENGQDMSIGSLRSFISVNPIADSNQIDISVKYTDAQTAKQIANSISENFVLYISKKAKTKGNEIAKKIEDQMLIEEENLKDKTQNLKEYLEINKSADMIKTELEALTAQSVAFKTQLNAEEKKLNATELLLGDLYNLAEDSDIDVKGRIELHILPQSKIDEDYIQHIDSDSLGGALLAIEISKTETNVLEARANIESLKKSLNELETQIVQAQLMFIDNEYQYNKVFNEYDIVRLSYLESQKSLKEILDIANTDIGKNSIEIISMAVAAQQPSEPDKTKNVIIAVLIGLILGCVIALFWVYHIEAKTKKPKTKAKEKN